MKLSARTLGVVRMLVVIGSVSGCVAGVRAEPMPPPEPVYVTAETVPVDIETYPATNHDGHAVFLWNERWYYRHEGRWVYYRHEPEELHRHRQSVGHAPPSQQHPPREEDRDGNKHGEGREDRHGEGRR